MGGLTKLASYFQSNDPYPITKATRLAYACKQSYIIDPTGWSIQPLGRASWPKCSSDIAAKWRKGCLLEFVHGCASMPFFADLVSFLSVLYSTSGVPTSFGSHLLELQLRIKL